MTSPSILREEWQRPAIPQKTAEWHQQSDFWFQVSNSHGIYINDKWNFPSPSNIPAIPVVYWKRQDTKVMRKVNSSSRSLRPSQDLLLLQKVCKSPWEDSKACGKETPQSDLTTRFLYLVCSLSWFNVYIYTYPYMCIYMCITRWLHAELEAVQPGVIEFWMTREFHYNFSPMSHWCHDPKVANHPCHHAVLLLTVLCRSRLKLHDSWIPKWGLKSKLLKFQNQSCDIPTKSSAFLQRIEGSGL